MPPSTRWIMYHYVAGKLKPLSKQFKTREQAEEARLKYPERERRKIGVGCIHK